MAKKSFEQFQEEAKTTWATLTKMQFMEVCAEVMSEEPMRLIIKQDPTNLMFLTMFSSRLADKMFDKNESEESEDKE